MGAERPFKGGLSPPATSPRLNVKGRVPFKVPFKYPSKVGKH